jgi:hypothetical protein
MPLNEETGEPDSDRIELGELAFPAARTIASGHVADGEGKPIAGVRVTLEQVRPRAGKRGREPDPPPRNPELGRVGALSAADGSYRLRAPFPVPGCRLQFWAENWFYESASIPGSGSCDVRMVAMARIAGHLDFEKFEGQEGLIVEAEPRPGGRRASMDVSTVGAEGFPVGGALAGTYDLLVRVRAVDGSQAEVLAQLEGVSSEGATADRAARGSRSVVGHARSVHVDLSSGGRRRRSGNQSSVGRDPWIRREGAAHALVGGIHQR